MADACVVPIEDNVGARCGLNRTSAQLARPPHPPGLRRLLGRHQQLLQPEGSNFYDAPQVETTWAPSLAMAAAGRAPTRALG